MNDSVTITVVPKPGDPLCACPFCNPLFAVADPKHTMKWIKFTPCSGIYKCDHCGALLVAGYRKK